MSTATEILIVKKDGSESSYNAIVLGTSKALFAMGVFSSVTINKEPFLDRTMNMTFLNDSMMGFQNIYIPTEKGTVEFKESQKVAGKKYDHRTLSYYFSDLAYDNNSEFIPKPIRAAKNFAILGIGRDEISIEFMKTLSVEIAKRLEDYHVYYLDRDTAKEDYQLVEAYAEAE